MPSHDVFSFVGTEWGQSQKEKKMGYGQMTVTLFFRGLLVHTLY